MRRRLHQILTTATLLCVATLMIGSPGAASAQVVPDTTTERAGDGGDATDGRLYVAPARFDPRGARPGDVLRFPVEVRNRTGQPVTLSMTTIALEGSDDPDEFARDGGRAARSAAAIGWVTYPGFTRARQLRDGRDLLVPAEVRVPAGATPGTYALGFAPVLRASSPAASTDEATRINVSFVPTSLAILRVPGDAVADARLRSIDAPRVVWGGAETFTVVVENVGDTDLTLDGKVDLNAFLGSAGRTLAAAGPDTGFLTLPDGRRKLEMRWSDPPLIGWFQPELVVVGGEGSGVRVTRELDTVFVLPPWWLLALLALAIALPVWLRRRRGGSGWTDARRARSRARVEERLRVQAAKRRAEAARRRR